MSAFELILEGIGAVEVVMVMGFLLVAAHYWWTTGRREKLRPMGANAKNSTLDGRLVVFPAQIEGLRKEPELLIRKRNPTGWQDRKLRSNAIVR